MKTMIATVQTHTPGPWEMGTTYATDPNSWSCAIFSPANIGKHHAARVAEALGLTKDEAEANAHLITAAPECNKHAKAAVEYLPLIEQNYPDLPGLIRALKGLKAAIALSTQNCTTTHGPE